MCIYIYIYYSLDVSIVFTLFLLDGCLIHIDTSNVSKETLKM